MTKNSSGGGGPTSGQHFGPRSRAVGSGCDIFRLPRVEVEGAAPCGSRRLRQRLAWQRRVDGEVNKTVDALNWLAGWRSDGDVFDPNRVQRGVLGLVRGRVLDRAPPDDAPSPEAAFRELLRGRSVMIAKRPM